jgi:HicB_like antitoxin of bacterial toxin-antitoxin system
VREAAPAAGLACRKCEFRPFGAERLEFGPDFDSPRGLADVDISDILALMAKVLVSLNDALLRRVDRIAKARGLSRSAYLSELAEHDVARSKGPGSTHTAHRALSRLDDLFAGGPAEESTSAIRAERDAR